jgi:hypothetical protein
MSILSPTGLETVDLGGTSWRIIYNQNFSDINDKMQYVLSYNTTATGNVTTGEDILMTYTLPADTLDTNGESVRIRAWGTTASNSNVKTIKLYFGTTILVTDSGSISGDSWLFEAFVIRTGAATEDAIGEGKINGIAPIITHTEPTANTAGAITIKITGEGTATNDIVAQGMVIEFIN